MKQEMQLAPPPVLEVQTILRSRSASSSGSLDKSKLDDLPTFLPRSRNVSQTASESFLSTSQALAPITEESSFTTETSSSLRSAPANSRRFSLATEQLHTFNIAQMRLADKNSSRKKKNKKQQQQQQQRGRSKSKRMDAEGPASSTRSKRSNAPTPVRAAKAAVRGRFGIDDLSDNDNFTDYGSSEEQIWQIRKISNEASDESSVLSMTMMQYFSAASRRASGSSTVESSLPVVFGLLPTWLRPDADDVCTSEDTTDVSVAPPPVWEAEVSDHN